MKLQSHIFVCTNERPADHPRGCCKAKNSETLVEEFKKQLLAKGLKGKVRAQKAGCLDTCEFGAAMVVYPEGVWYGKVTLDDVPEIIEKHIQGGQPVDRLRIPGK